MNLTRRALIYGALINIDGMKLLIRRQPLHSNHIKSCPSSTTKINFQEHKTTLKNQVHGYIVSFENSYSITVETI